MATLKLPEEGRAVVMSACLIQCYTLSPVTSLHYRISDMQGCSSFLPDYYNDKLVIAKTDMFNLQETKPLGPQCIDEYITKYGLTVMRVFLKKNADIKCSDQEWRTVHCKN